jgi:hypothetical protein
MNDKELINQLGGVRAVCNLLGYKSKFSYQRVHNWLTRGIPEIVKLRRPDVFLLQQKKVAKN